MSFDLCVVLQTHRAQKALSLDLDVKPDGGPACTSTCHVARLAYFSTTGRKLASRQGRGHTHNLAVRHPNSVATGSSAPLAEAIVIANGVP